MPNRTLFMSLKLLRYIYIWLKELRAYQEHQVSAVEMCTLVTTEFFVGKNYMVAEKRINKQRFSKNIRNEFLGS